MNKVLKLKPEHWQVMRRHVAAQAPLEACGLLAGKQDSVETVLRVRNAERSPVRFRMDAQEQYNAFEWIDANGLDLVGIFHSHPSGPETVSPTDIAQAAYEVVHIIWSRPKRTWNARGYWIEKGKATEVTLQVLSEQ
jgi:[CysO sulfur-carrier protein]-S-L-cysteine hydrolase